MQAYKLLPSPIDVWGELAKKYNMFPNLGDLLILSTKDQDKLTDWGLEIPKWLKFNACVNEGEMFVVRLSSLNQLSFLCHMDYEVE